MTIGETPLLGGLPVVLENVHGKMLRTWTLNVVPAGIFVKSGMYGLSDGVQRKTRMRGIKAEFVDYDHLMNQIPKTWKNDQRHFEYDHKFNVTIAAACEIEKDFHLAGAWVIEKLRIEIGVIGTKRQIPVYKLPMRARGLATSQPAENPDDGLSAPYCPQWLDPDAEAESLSGPSGAALECRMS